MPATPFTSENVSVKRSARGVAPDRGARSEEGVLDLAEDAARLGVVARGGEIRNLQAGCERERAEPPPGAGKLRERDAARAGALSEEPHEARGLVGDLAMALVGVGRVVVEELHDLRADRVRQLGAGDAVRVHEERRDRVRELRGRAVRAVQRALGSSDGGEEVVDRRAGRVRPRRRDVERAVVVGAAGERDPARVRRLDAVLVGERGEEGGLDRSGEAARELVRLARACAVASLPGSEEQHHPLDVARRDRRPHAVERMRERVREAALAEERDELVHRRAVRLEVAVILLGEVPHEDVQRDFVLGEARRHLDGQERVGLVRDAQRALDRVVVADRDVRHAALPADAIHALGLRVRLAETCAAECVVPAVRRVDRVDVQVAAAHCLTCKPLSGRLLPVSGA